MLDMLRKRRLFYVSPWLLAAATGLLVLIVVTFALSNIQREKRLMTDTLLQKASTLMRFVQAGARAAYLADLKESRWQLQPWPDYIQRIIDHVAEDPDISFLAIVDQHGTVIAHNDTRLLGHNLAIPPEESATRQESVRRQMLAFRVVAVEGHGKVFEAVRPFEPYRAIMSPRFSAGGGGRPHHFLPFFSPRSPGEELLTLEPLGPDPRQTYFIVVGLDMREFDSSLQGLRLQVLILSLAMLLVGVGGWLSLAAVQGYRVSQRTLREMRAFTGHLVARLPVGIIATDKNGQITTWNGAAVEMTGVRAEEATGKQPGEVLPPELAPYFSAGDEPEGSSQGDGRRQEEIRLTGGEKEHVLLCHGIAIRDDEANYMGRVLLLSNLTELKNLEQEMRENERLAAVGRMAAGVAHEVRNPLSSIKGLALLLKGKFAEQSKERETATLLICEVERMNRTISELLSFTRPEPLQLVAVDVPPLLREELKLIAADAASSGVTTKLLVAEGLAPVAGDRDRLNQVFINIMLNALQAMGEGGELFVAARSGEKRRSAVVTITDTGCGISEADLAQVFYPYFTTKPGGTGIGLAISQKIVADHRGTIKIDSTPGKGTTVSVELPLFPPDQPL